MPSKIGSEKWRLGKGLLGKEGKYSPRGKPGFDEEASWRRKPNLRERKTKAGLRKAEKKNDTWSQGGGEHEERPSRDSCLK